jgi:hypothetical protein
MRLVLLPLVVLPLVAFACGGPAKEPMHPDPSGPEGSLTATGEPSSPTTTTDVGPESTGGTKLPVAGSTGTTASTAGPKSAGELGRSQADIQSIIAARRDEARACYDSGLKTSPTLEGDIAVQWLIDPKGVVTEVTIAHDKSQIHDEGVGKCIMALVKSVKFNASGKGFETRASYTYNFHPKRKP